MEPLAAPRSLYLHVPFCPHICPYCDFHKMRRNEGLVARFVEHIEREAEAMAARWPGRLDTVYFGGGTPSHLSDLELERLLRAIERGWGGLGALETTLEADPNTFDAERARRWRDRGITRLSIGAQSTQATALRFLGRSHTPAEGLRAIADALAAGLIVSADIITAVPGQDLAVDLRSIAGSGVQHASVYTLTIESDTPFGRRGLQVDEERAADDFDLTESLLADQGLHRYEVSNHARSGFEAQHNAVYWRGDAYLALGPGAAGLLPISADTAFINDGAEPETAGPWGGGEHLAVRTLNPPIKAWLAGAAPERTRIDALDFALELLMTGLRRAQGVDATLIAQRTGVDLGARCPRALQLAIEQQALTFDGRILRATKRGMRVLNAVLRPFFSEAAEQTDHHPG